MENATTMERWESSFDLVGATDNLYFTSMLNAVTAYRFAKEVSHNESDVRYWAQSIIFWAAHLGIEYGPEYL